MAEKALVLGLGVSGKAASDFLRSLGYEVVAIESNLSETFSIQEFSLLVLSPGFPPTHFLVQEALKQGIEVIGEAELGARYIKQKAVAITGTNGKTTVTSLVEHVLCSSGKKAKALGNIGEPLTKYVLSRSDLDEIAVVELSSYQLETMTTPIFEAAVVLNITPDHLDRYSSMQEYAKAKAKIQHTLKSSGDLFLYQEVVSEYGALFPDSFHVFGGGGGDHDQLNIEAARLLCLKLGVSNESFYKALESFEKPSHRIEFIREIGGVFYYDDSKGTNIDAVIRAVRSMKGPVLLIAGGVDKGSSYLPWKEAFTGKVKNIFLIGQAASKIQQELQDFFDIKKVDSLEEAVFKAAASAVFGDSVLLSPGCSSFDMFRDYVHRGNEFQRCVGLLQEESKSNA